MSIVNVKFNVDKCLKAIDDIFKRRRDRKENFVQDVSDSLDAIHEIIKTMNNIFLMLVGNFTNKKVTSNSKRLSKLIEETNKYLSIQDLLPKLQDGIGIIEGVAKDQRFKDKKYSIIKSDLLDLKKRVEEYREELGKGGITGVGMKEEWNLMTLIEKVNGIDNTPVMEQAPIEKIAKRVQYNFNSDLSDDIYRLIGKIRIQAKIFVI
ncbi:hypothetical protein LCGC14_0517730 [marine sediment metagenome]|uniref:Uncharacterized protein n=1 Tax=marine sediment metagenome TaxID=412755 RepID=A0A0F9UKX7_9ZZZZ|nr:hypothetical protein [bacterium]